MGNKKSLLEKPYKNGEATFDKNQSEKLIDEIKRVKISTYIQENGSGKWNFLLLGPCGAGKSSFINSVISISKGKYLNSAFTGGLNIGSITRKFAPTIVFHFTPYTLGNTRGRPWSSALGRCLQNTCLKAFGSNFNDFDFDIQHMGSQWFYSSGSFDNLRFYDTAGLMETEGFNTEMMTRVLSGNVKEGYDFSQKSVIDDDDPFYRDKPTKADMVHCVIYIVDICSLSTMDKTLKEKIIRLQQYEIDSDIQRVLILTKCDELCDSVKNDVTNIYKSKKVCDEAENARHIFGIARGNTHPVVNYGERGSEINPAMNVPVLLALKQCVDFSNEYIEQQMKYGSPMKYDAPMENDAPMKNDAPM